MTLRFARTLPFVLWLMLMAGPPALAQPPADPTAFPPQTSSETSDSRGTVTEVRRAMIRLPLAAVLGAMLGLRPRRKGTPVRQPAVIQTQIILAIVGSVVMLVVGSSLARAFGIVGAAGLVRYRAKIEDPKDAGVMLSTLAVGLAAGVGVWVLATFATGFFLLVLWIVESFEPKAKKLFTLKVKAKDPAALKPRIEELLTRHHVKFELRGTSTEELHYEVRIPFDHKADGLTDAIVALDRDNASAADLEEKKEKK